jgi:hypothetical protein
VIIYLVGVIVALAPAIGAKWSAAPASDLAASALQGLPNALAWPARRSPGFDPRIETAVC